MNLKIVTSSKVLLETDGVSQVNIPTLSGDIGVLPGHIPLISIVGYGALNYIDDKGKSHVIAVSGGFLRIGGDEIFVMVDDAELPENIVLAEIEDAIKRAHEKKSTDLPASELIQLEKQLRFEYAKKISLDASSHQV